MRRLVVYSWPGNVRELENALRAALARALAWGDEVIGPEHLEVGVSAAEEPEPGDGLLAATDRFQRERVREALAACNGNRLEAARRLGVSRQWMYRLIARWGDP
jgi:DNA-binding NtrC family response regulator